MFIINLFDFLGETVDFQVRIFCALFLDFIRRAVPMTKPPAALRRGGFCPFRR
jgi:hypothetical protein